MNQSRRLICITPLFALTLFTLIALTSAPLLSHTLETSDRIHISSLHSIDDDLYAFGEEVQIEGTIAGDLITGCSVAHIRGEIGGSSNIFANRVEFSGRSTNSIRAFGQYVTISGTTGRSLVAYGSEVEVSKGAVIERDASLGAAIVRIDGVIKGNADVDGASVIITGQIEGDLNVEGEKIRISPPAVIQGNVNYESKEEDALTQEPGVTIVGEVTWQPPETKEKEEDSGLLADVTFKIACLLAAFIFGLVVTAFFRPYAEEAAEQLQTRLAASFAAGVVGLLVLVFALVILTVSATLALAGLIMLSTDVALLGVLILVFSILMLPITSFVSVVGGIVFYSAVILVGFVLGRWALKILGGRPAKLSYPGLLIGLVILTLVFWLPYTIGTVLWVLVSILGAGAIALGFKHCRKETVTRLQEDAGPAQPASGE